MKTIALVSTCGRAGRTSLTAILASLLARRGHRVLALECDPQNLLALHLGLSTFPTYGLATHYHDALAWADTAMQNSDNVTFVPFGHMPCHELFAFEAMLALHPFWLAQQLTAIDNAQDMLVLIDTARMPSVYAEQAIRAADYVVVLLQADGEFFATLSHAKHWIQAQGDKPHGYLINAFDTSRPLQHDVLAAMLGQLGKQLSPYLIHRDESIPAAFAKLSFVADNFPQSLAVHDLQGQCDWLLTQLGIAPIPVTPLSTAETSAPPAVSTNQETETDFVIPDATPAASACSAPPHTSADPIGSKTIP